MPHGWGQNARHYFQRAALKDAAIQFGFAAGRAHGRSVAKGRDLYRMGRLVITDCPLSHGAALNATAIEDQSLTCPPWVLHTKVPEPELELYQRAQPLF